MTTDQLTSVHLAPLPDGHAADDGCWCMPVRSLRIGDAQLMIHRTDPDYADPLIVGRKEQP